MGCLRAVWGHPTYAADERRRRELSTGEQCTLTRYHHLSVRQIHEGHHHHHHHHHHRT